MMGKTIIAWLWLEMANQAQLKFGTSSQQEDQAFLAVKFRQLNILFIGNCLKLNIRPNY